MKFLRIPTAVYFALLFFTSCKKNDVTPGGSPPPFTISDEVVTLNPNGDAPLTAMISLKTSVPTKISMVIVGKHGPESDVTKDFDSVNTVHSIPVLGLYPSYANLVALTFKDAAGVTLQQKTDTIPTDSLPSGVFPAITIDIKVPTEIAKGMTLVSYFGFKTNVSPQQPFIFDAFGDVRWYADFTAISSLNNLFYDDGVERLQNGNFYFGDKNSNTIYEMDLLGKIINTWLMPGYAFHHEVLEKPNGNFLVSVSKQGIATIEDFIIEIDRSTKQIINTWDLRQSLQYARRTLINDNVDWIHVNALVYDPSDNTIIISGRTQGLVKLDKDNKVIWIMGSHKGWGTAGNGADLTSYLLQPLDKNDVPITDQNVLNGNTNHADFEWNWYQHAPKLMPNGHFLIFDNGGDNRNFSGAGQYSRAVEYEINSTDKTVKQIWEYGKERGGSTFAHIVSDVDYLSDVHHIIFSPGSVNQSTNYGKVIELDYTTKDILFEATLTPPATYFGITFHRTERLSLYE